MSEELDDLDEILTQQLFRAEPGVEVDVENVDVERIPVPNGLIY